MEADEEGGGEDGMEADARESIRTRAMRFVVLLGLVSLFADMTYEGARSATGPFLLSLGASAGVVGVVGGLGELAGYALRLGSGYLSDRIRRYWFITGIGYAMNLLAVPILALAGRWETAALLVVGERVGKAVRTPSRDVMLSYAAHQTGRGFGFGLHEALDQVGAVVGPLVVAGVLASGAGYRAGFGVLLIPALLALAILAAARSSFPSPEHFEAQPSPAVSDAEEDGRALRGPKSLPRKLWLYVAFGAMSVAGFAHFQLISFHFKARGLMTDPAISVSFALAMAVDALVALLAGRLYDRIGMGVLLSLPVGTVAAALLAFGGTPQAWAGMVVWGAVMGVQETVMRAAVADLAPTNRRGVAYGLFNAAFGAAWFAGSSLMGLLYQWSPVYVPAFSAVTQAMAIPLFVAMNKAGVSRESPQGEG